MFSHDGNMIPFVLARIVGKESREAWCLCLSTRHLVALSFISAFKFYCSFLEL